MNFELYCAGIARLLGTIETVDRAGHWYDRLSGTDAAVDLIVECSKNGNKILIIGNGGSAAIASHLQNDLSKAVGVRAMVFYDLSLLTAISNDHGYEASFEKPIKQWIDPGDILIAISSSGKSENILKAVRAALNRKAKVITMTGFETANSLRGMGDINFYINSTEYGMVESAHAILSHYLTDKAMKVALE